MTELPPGGVREDPEAFIEYLRNQYKSEDGLAEYLELLYEDYYDGNLTDSERYYTVGEDEVDIGPIIDMAVFFGFVWERDDPDETHE